MKHRHIAINGFGRIGRTLFRILLDHPEYKVAALNDLADNRTLSHLLKYDSIHGVLNKQVGYTETGITVDGSLIPVFHEALPSHIPWEKTDVTLVVESTGKFKNRESLNGHLRGGVRTVLLSVPPDEDTIPMIVMGVNEASVSSEEPIISNASCTTNNAAPMIYIMDTLCGIEQAYITTIHSYTTDQSLHDVPHRDLRRARAAAQSIVPTTTGAAKALTKVFPHLSDVMGGCGIRVPVPDGSLTDITFNVKHPVSIEEVNQAFKKASMGSMSGILAYTEDPIVSVDVLHNPASCLFDSLMTSVIGRMVKIIGWYDNEYGYSSRLVDLINHVNKK